MIRVTEMGGKETSEYLVLHWEDMTPWTWTLGGHAHTCRQVGYFELHCRPTLAGRHRLGSPTCGGQIPRT